ncbi:MAG: hydrolase, partial [Anaerolineae bacterium]|nr:hydrolase [Anaerolineae bacterium]
MQFIRIALVQLGWPGSREKMMETYRHLIRQAADQGAVLVCLPEFSLSPYFPGTRDRAGMTWAESLENGPTADFFGELAQKHQLTITASIFERATNDRFYDTATIYNPKGDLAAYTRKIHIPSGEGYHETDFFEGGEDYPVFDLGALMIATPTCYDQWFPELARIYALNGAEFIFYPTAIGSEPTDPHIDTQEAWQTVMRGHAIANGVFIGAANRIGQENDVRFYGSSFICAPTGAILAQAGRDTTE